MRTIMTALAPLECRRPRHLCVCVCVCVCVNPMSMSMAAQFVERL